MTEVLENYKGFDIRTDRMLGYSLYETNGYIWMQSARRVSTLKQSIDRILKYREERKLEENVE
jgi:hypothetical protein